MPICNKTKKEPPSTTVKSHYLNPLSNSFSKMWHTVSAATNHQIRNTFELKPNLFSIFKFPVYSDQSNMVYAIICPICNINDNPFPHYIGHSSRTLKLRLTSHTGHPLPHIIPL